MRCLVCNGKGCIKSSYSNKKIACPECRGKGNLVSEQGKKAGDYLNKLWKGESY